MAVPSIASSSTLALATGRTTTSVPVPSGVVAGSFVLVYLYLSTTRVAVTPPLGFTEVAWASTPSLGSFNMRAFWKKASTADSGTYDFTHASATTGGWAYRILDAVGVESGKAVGTSATATTSAPISTITNGPDRLLLHWTVGSTASNTYTPSAGFTELYDTSGIHIASKAQAVAGATGTVAASASSVVSSLATLLAVTSAGNYVTDTFTGADGTVPAGWTVDVSNVSASGVINSNKLRLTALGSTPNNVRAIRNSPATADDLDMTGSIQFMSGDSTTDQRVMLYLHQNGPWSANTNATHRPTSGYMLHLFPALPNYQILLQRYAAAAPTDLISALEPAITGYFGVARFRFQAFRSNSTVRFRYWYDGTPEPATWQLSYTDPTPPPAGKVGFGVLITAVSGNGAARPADIDDVVVTNQFVPPAVNRVVERWNGTALVPLSVQMWNGSSLVSRFPTV